VLNDSPHHRYLRVLGAFYLRLVGRPMDIYQYLEPLYNDYRKIKLRGTSGRSVSWALRLVLC
jgi:pre-mRNA-splicing factor 38A